jgi:hypothetical protein
MIVTSGMTYDQIKENEIIEKARTIQLATEVGLAPMEDFKAGPYHYGLIMTKIA